MKIQRINTKIIRNYDAESDEAVGELCCDKIRCYIPGGSMPLEWKYCPFCAEEFERLPEKEQDEPIYKLESLGKVEKSLKITDSRE